MKNYTYVIISPSPNQKNFAREKLRELGLNIDQIGISLLTEGELMKSTRTFDVGIKIGNLINASPIRSKLITSPRVKKLCLFHYEVFRNNSFQPFEVFDQNANENSIFSFPPNIDFKETSKDPDQNFLDTSQNSNETLINIENLEIEIEEIKLREIDSSLSEHFSNSVTTSRHEVDTYVLETMTGKKILWDKDASIDSVASDFFINNLSLPEKLEVESLKPEEIMSGDCIFFFAKGGKEYLDNVSLQIDENYNDIKNSLYSWKGYLQNFVENQGLDFLNEQLRGNCSKIERIPAWMDFDQGGPGSKNDFYALLDAIGRSENKKKHWQDIEKWRSIRTKAGRKVSQSIKSSISVEQISDISKELFLIFSIKEFEGAEVHAYLIEEAKKYKKMPISKLRQAY